MNAFDNHMVQGHDDPPATDWQEQERRDALDADMDNDEAALRDQITPFTTMHIPITDKLLQALAVAQLCMGNAGKGHQNEIASLAISLQCARIRAGRAAGVAL